MSKLNWYDWNGVGEIPSGVVGIRDRNGDEWRSYEDGDLELDDNWTHSGDESDIIAYTLGEPLEVDDV